MSAINDLIAQIENPELRDRLQYELDKLNKQKKFGLVFEEHLPECTPLYDIPVKKGALVAMKDGDLNSIYFVSGIDNATATCVNLTTKETKVCQIDKLVSVAKFGDPIYPCLKQMDSVCNAPDSDLWHALIEADNYHALQLLEYLYAGKVDCIYIDPPYNTGARDWKYNNNYVDNTDAYRHSKWLSMMQKRLRIAKRILNPKNSVLIITIDEKEYLHLGCLLEEIFPESKMQMISTVIKPEGTNRVNEFSRTNEYIFFLIFGDAVITPNSNSMFDTGDSESDSESDPEEDGPRELEWRNLRRRENTSVRSARPNQFYPIFVGLQDGIIKSIGEAISVDVNRNDVIVPDGCYAIFPLTPQGLETLWGKHYETARTLLNNGYLKVTNGKNPAKAIVKYLSTGTVNDIILGKICITGRGEQNEVVGHYHEKEKLVMPKTMWYMPSHNSQTNGSLLLKKVIGENRFTFPKSLYAVRDTLRFFVANKPHAIIVDFFAGSGTTLHAVNLLNAEDDGHRRCIMVTNNEVSETEAQLLTEQGYHQGDDEWEKLGIARYVNWPRTVCSIEGHDVNGSPIKGDYIGCDRPMSDGFNANAVFFKLSFLDKNAVALGRQFKEMLPILWMKAGSYGICPVLTETLPRFLLLAQNRFAVLLVENAFSEFEIALDGHPEIETVYIVTDYEAGYRTMVKNLKVQYTYQLYRDYLDNFRINTERN